MGMPGCDSKLKRTLKLLFAGAAILPLSALCASDSVQFPEGFRQWVHVSTKVLMPVASGQSKVEPNMHHIFANPEAVGSYASGDFADGSIIVFEVRELQQEKDGMLSEGERKRVDVMIKDSSHAKNTGGWRFERFWGKDQAQNALQDSGAACFQCHSKAHEHGFVFSHLQ